MWPDFIYVLNVVSLLLLIPSTASILDSATVKRTCVLCVGLSGRLAWSCVQHFRLRVC